MEKLPTAIISIIYDYYLDLWYAERHKMITLYICKLVKKINVIRTPLFNDIITIRWFIHGNKGKCYLLLNPVYVGHCRYNKRGDFIYDPWEMDAYRMITEYNIVLFDFDLNVL